MAMWLLSAPAAAQSMIKALQLMDLSASEAYQLDDYLHDRDACFEVLNRELRTLNVPEKYFMLGSQGARNQFMNVPNIADINLVRNATLRVFSIDTTTRASIVGCVERGECGWLFSHLDTLCHRTKDDVDALERAVSDGQKLISGVVRSVSAFVLPDAPSTRRRAMAQGGRRSAAAHEPSVTSRALSYMGHMVDGAAHALTGRHLSLWNHPIAPSLPIQAGMFDLQDLLVCWVVVAIACVPALMWLRRPDMDVDGFYYHDDLTSCAFEFQRTLPEANLRNRLTSFVAPLASLKVMYDDVRDLQVRNTSLRTLCGHCSLHAFTLHGVHGLNEHLVLGRRPPVEDSELGLVNVLLPANVPREWAREWTEEVRRVVGARAGASFTNIHQAERDLVASIRSNGWPYAASMAATLIALCAAMRTYARDVRTACGLAVLVLVVVAGSIGIGEAVCKLFSLPTTPYNAVIAPIVLGTGVDASLILMNAFRATSSLAIAWPSIVASQATTLLSFAIGTLLPVPHIQWFFVHSMVTMVTSFLVQVAFFSYAAKHASYRKLGYATSQGAPPPRLWQWFVLAIGLMWAAAGVAWRPPRVEFNMQNQISSAMQTYRFLAATARANRSQVVPMYALVRSVDANWTDVYRRMRSLGATPVLDWHSDFVESRAPNLSAWRERPSTQLMFETLVSDAGPSAVYASLVLDVDMEWGFGSQGGYTDALQRLEDLRTPEVCFASLDLMDGHTISRVVAAVWKLALASCGLCTLLALVIARHHGLACFAALLMSYALALTCLSAMRIKVHMMLVAAFLVAPGLLTDYIMHMTFNADTRTAVAWSAFTSMVSIVPYAASSSRGLRDFATAYAVLVIAGALHAFAITCTRSAEYFLLRKGGRQGEGGADA